MVVEDPTSPSSIHRCRTHSLNLALGLTILHKSYSSLAHFAQTAKKEFNTDTLEDGVFKLLLHYKARNHGLPASIVVYRDGVSEGSFPLVLEQELPSIYGALARHGDVDTTKVAVVVCQKRHQTRFVYEEVSSDGSKNKLNPCPGIVVDAAGGDRAIVSEVINEFYLNSHTAIQGVLQCCDAAMRSQCNNNVWICGVGICCGDAFHHLRPCSAGTSRPCKYSLIHDNIGFKVSAKLNASTATSFAELNTCAVPCCAQMAELELLTYWTTYLYARCNKSVSYATPAYYAHVSTAPQQHTIHALDIDR